MKERKGGKKGSEKVEDVEEEKSAREETRREGGELDDRDRIEG